MKKLLSMLLVLALAVTVINVPVKASDDNGIWVLKNHNTVVNEGSSATGAWWYDTDYKYDDAKGEVTHYITVHLTNVDGTFQCDTYATCSIPPKTITADQDVLLDVYSYVSGNSLDGHINMNNATVNIKGYSLYWRDVDDYSHYYITSETGPGYKQSDAAKTSYVLGKGRTLGETTTIQFTQNSGAEINTYWEYEWVDINSIKQAPGKATVKTAKVKKNTLTVAAKSIKCDGYQIQVSNYSDFRDTTDTKFATVSYFSISNKATFDNRLFNKTKYIRIRAFNKDGEDLTFGEWSQVKKLSK